MGVFVWVLVIGLVLYFPLWVSTVMLELTHFEVLKE